ncbi:MAG TPA: FAD-binding protein [Tepidisphaeraceae bacterium]|nr:FAD-binding protein [Tepidisphaeraceae bacterium]
MTDDTRPDRTPLVPPGGIDHHSADMTATFAADVTLKQAQAALGQREHWLPIDGDEDLPLGQLIEQNSTGPLRLGYGAWRDLLLGVQFQDGHGKLITAGGATVKNVAGYDLTKFMVGQRGVFGQIVTLTTRTYRRPAVALLARFPARQSIINALLPTDHRPQWALLTREALNCGYLGDEQFGAFQESGLRQAGALHVARRTLRDDIEHRAGLWCCYNDLALRTSVPPARIAEFVSLAKLSAWVADAAFGIVISSPTSETSIEAVNRAAIRVGGTLTITYPRQSRFEVSTTDTERGMIERLKDAFDPENRLTPLPWRS